MIEVCLETLIEGIEDFTKVKEKVRNTSCPFWSECKYCIVIFPEWAENYIRYMYWVDEWEFDSTLCPCHILGVEFVAEQVRRFIDEIS